MLPGESTAWVSPRHVTPAVVAPPRRAPGPRSRPPRRRSGCRARCTGWSACTPGQRSRARCGRRSGSASCRRGEGLVEADEGRPGALRGCLDAVAEVGVRPAPPPRLPPPAGPGSGRPPTGCSSRARAPGRPAPAAVRSRSRIVGRFFSTVCDALGHARGVDLDAPPRTHAQEVVATDVDGHESNLALARSANTASACSSWLPSSKVHLPPSMSEVVVSPLHPGSRPRETHPRLPAGSPSVPGRRCRAARCPPAGSPRRASRPGRRRGARARHPTVVGDGELGRGGRRRGARGSHLGVGAARREREHERARRSEERQGRAGHEVLVGREGTHRMTLGSESVASIVPSASSGPVRVPVLRHHRARQRAPHRRCVGTVVR
jgi:hypothetical protein